MPVVPQSGMGINTYRFFFQVGQIYRTKSKLSGWPGFVSFSKKQQMGHLATRPQTV